MPIKIEKQLRENSQSLTRRFSRRIKQSGILRRAKKIRFRKRPKSKQLKKKGALRKEELRKEYEELKKLGKEK
ncbi:hypothetical protein KAT95_02175 [Candidatus Parcubacteria bacterium]|nr:hypothetical protein [Candidatus Parcubacteria bacterium]